MPPIPTAPVAAGSFVLSYGVVVASGSRALGGLVLLAGGSWCAYAWRRRRDVRTAAELVGVALVAFVASHLLGLAIGAWPAVALAALSVGAAAWIRADGHRGHARDLRKPAPNRGESVLTALERPPTR